MRRWPVWVAAALGAKPAIGQAPAELGGHLIVVASDPAQWGLGPAGRIRLSADFALALGVAGVRRGSRTEGRGEATLQFRLTRDPARSRAAWYLAGGLAGITGADGGGSLVAGLGCEWRVRRADRWWLEAGVAGGVRVVGGYRVGFPARRRPPPR